MVGASDPSIATALAAQSKQLDAQSRNIVAQSKILQQLCDRFESQDARWSSLEKSVAHNSDDIAILQSQLADRADRGSDVDTNTRVAALENVQSVFDSWRARMDASVDDMRADLTKVSRFLERGAATEAEAASGVLGPYQSATAERPPAPAWTADGPIGHHADLQPRGLGFGVPYTHHPPPALGTHLDPVPPFAPNFPAANSQEFNTGWYYPTPHSAFGGRAHGAQFTNYLGQLPKINFPEFDGTLPKLWQSRCEFYFNVYMVDPSVWIQVATMNFKGPASRWLQSVEHRLAQVSWPEFGSMIRERFGKDQHEHLLRQLLHIRQVTSVTDYIEQFAQLVDHLNAYQSQADPLYYTTKFIDGLRDDVRATVLVQRPRDLDTAYVLAQLQEEVHDAHKPRDTKTYARGVPRPYASSGATLDIKNPSSAKLDTSTSKPSTVEDRLTALYAYRKAKGLCYKCGLQYSRGHRCADSVQLHLVEEVWQSLQLSDEEDSPNSPTAEEANMISLSQAATVRADAPKTIRFLGHIGGMEILILLDSGSSVSFISRRVADHLPHCTPVSKPLLVQVANGGQLSCDRELLNTTWYLNEYEFSSTLRVLDLNHYDVILGMDWLSRYSPMFIHWSAKWLIIPYKGSSIKLWGMGAPDVQCAAIEVCAIETLPDKDQTLVQQLPQELQQLLGTYADLFEVPQGLPTQRECDHRIPLIDGARPVQLRPYRYAPALKTEIENQVAEMLQSALSSVAKVLSHHQLFLLRRRTIPIDFVSITSILMHSL
jgi:hypothetical protein